MKAALYSGNHRLEVVTKELRPVHKALRQQREGIAVKSMVIP